MCMRYALDVCDCRLYVCEVCCGCVVCMCEGLYWIYMLDCVRMCIGCLVCEVCVQAMWYVLDVCGVCVRFVYEDVWNGRVCGRGTY